jgi:hypothetical protein
MTDQLPAKVRTGALAVSTDTYLVPALIAAAGEQAGWRYVEFFTANIRIRAGPTRAPATGSSPGVRTAV